MGWIDQARARVREVTLDIPADATLPERRKALRKEGPLFHGGTYWGRKMWGRACREYLERHGQKPRSPADSPALLARIESGDIIFPFRGEQSNGDGVSER